MAQAVVLALNNAVDFIGSHLLFAIVVLAIFVGLILDLKR